MADASPREIMWWTGWMVCRICSHWHVGVVEVLLARNYNPPDCECPNCGNMACEPSGELPPDDAKR